MPANVKHLLRYMMSSKLPVCPVVVVVLCSSPFLCTATYETWLIPLLLYLASHACAADRSALPGVPVTQSPSIMM